MTIPAMILSAGRGERMRPLTDHTPKPLLTVHGKPLMQWHMEALARQGFTDLVVNTAWLGEKISDHFDALTNQDGLTLLSKQEQSALHTSIRYSHEGRDFGHALENTGGIVRALPMLGPHFWVLAGDVYAPDFVFSQRAVDRFIASGKLAHFWLVPNPAHNLKGDFGLSADGLALNQADEMFTFSTIALYNRALFELPHCDIPLGNPQGIKAPLPLVMRAATALGQASAELYTGAWTDVGTPERWAQLNQAGPARTTS